MKPALLALCLAPVSCQQGAELPPVDLPGAAPPSGGDLAMPARPACSGGWCWENPLPQGGPLLRLWARAADDAWAVGAAGAILHYDGRAWRPVPSPTTAELRGVWARSATEAWAVGAAGTVLRWDGAAWTQIVPSGTTDDLCHVFGRRPPEVWAFGCSFKAEPKQDAWSTPTWALAQLRWDGARLDPQPSRQSLDVLRAPTIDLMWGQGGEIWRAEDVPYDGTRYPVTYLSRLTDAGWLSEDSRGGSYRTYGGYRALWSAGPDLLLASWWENRIPDGSGNGARSSAGVLRWDGRQVSPFADGGANAIGGTGPDDIWTVLGVQARHYRGGAAPEVLQGVLPETGFVTAARGLFFSLEGAGIRRWDGAGGSELTAPSGPKADLSGVFTDGAGQAWAVDADGAVLRRGDGRWEVHSRPSTKPLGAIFGAGNLLWAVGAPGESRVFDGSRWAPFDVPAAEALSAIAGTAPDDLWVSSGSELLHYNGAAWDRRYAPAAGLGDRCAIAPTGRDRAWVACRRQSAPPGGTLAMLVRWDGAAFQDALPEEIDRDEALLAIWARGPSDVWLRGTRRFYRHDGTAWTTAAAGTADASACALAGDGAADLYAVCSYAGAGSEALRFDGARWTVTPLPLTEVRGLGASGGRLLAVGPGGAVLGLDLAARGGRP